MASDLSSVRAGQTGTFVQAVQVTDAGDQGCIVKSGTFVPLTATPDDRPTGKHYAATAL